MFELPGALTGVADIEAARHEISVPGTVAVVWLCDDETGAHALCFCGRDGVLAVRPLSVTAPLAPPDAAAVALSVKMLLGAPPPASAPTRPPPVTTEPSSTLGAAHLTPGRTAPTPPPTLALELAAGARLQSPPRNTSVCVSDSKACSRPRRSGGRWASVSGSRPVRRSHPAEARQRGER